MIKKMTDFWKNLLKVPEYLRHWSRDSEFITSDILDILLRLSLCWMNTPNYQQNDGLLGSFTDVYSMLLKCIDKGS